MLARTHIAFAILLSLLFYNYFTISPYFFIPLIIIGALLVDIDEPESVLGKGLGIVSKFISKFFGHRGILHTIYLPLIILLILLYFGFFEYGLAIFIGYISHLLLDGFTVAGVDFLKPLATLKLNGFIVVGSISEIILLILLIAGIIAKIYFMVF